MQCCLENRAFMKSPAEFGIYKESQLMTKLFVDGMWTRCQTCAKTVTGSKPDQRNTINPKEMARRKAHEEAVKEREAGSARITCTVCNSEKLTAEFPPNTAHHAARAHRRCRACYLCGQCDSRFTLLEFEPDADTCNECTCKKTA